MNSNSLVEGLWILDPTSDPELMQVKIAPRPDTLDGRVVGLLDNGKSKAGEILDLTTDLLAKRYNLAGVVRRQKRNAGAGAPEEMLDEIAEECQVAIVGIGD